MGAPAWGAGVNRPPGSQVEKPGRQLETGLWRPGVRSRVRAMGGLRERGSSQSWRPKSG